jgi:hypothetical protein
MPEPPRTRKPSLLSADTWAVLVSVGLALLVRFGLIKAVPW